MPPDGIDAVGVMSAREFPSAPPSAKRVMSEEQPATRRAVAPISASLIAGRETLPRNTALITLPTLSIHRAFIKHPSG